MFVSKKKTPARIPGYEWINYSDAGWGITTCDPPHPEIAIRDGMFYIEDTGIKVTALLEMLRANEIIPERNESWEQIRTLLDGWFGGMVKRPQMYGQRNTLELVVFNHLDIEMTGYGVPDSDERGVLGLYAKWLRRHGVVPGACVSAFSPGNDPSDGDAAPPTEEEAYEILIKFVYHTRSQYLPPEYNSTLEQPVFVIAQTASDIEIKRLQEFLRQDGILVCSGHKVLIVKERSGETLKKDLAGIFDAGNFQTDTENFQIYEGTVPPEVLKTLSRPMQLLITAQQNLQSKPRDPGGTGIPWDAPGRQAPRALNEWVQNLLTLQGEPLANAVWQRILWKDEPVGPPLNDRESESPEDVIIEQAKVNEPFRNALNEICPEILKFHLNYPKGNEETAVIHLLRIVTMCKLRKATSLLAAWLDQYRTPNYRKEIPKVGTSVLEALATIQEPDSPDLADLWLQMWGNGPAEWRPLFFIGLRLQEPVIAVSEVPQLVRYALAEGKSWGPLIHGLWNQESAREPLRRALREHTWKDLHPQIVINELAKRGITV